MALHGERAYIQLYVALTCGHTLKMSPHYYLDPDKSLNCLPKLARAVAGMRVPAAGHCEPASGPHLSSIIAPSFGLVLFSPELGGLLTLGGCGPRASAHTHI